MASKIERLEEVRGAVEDASRRKTRLEGQMDGHQRRLTELKEKCREEYECEIDELPDLISKLDAEAEEAISKAEEMLEIT